MAFRLIPQDQSQLIPPANLYQLMAQQAAGSSPDQDGNPSDPGRSPASMMPPGTPAAVAKPQSLGQRLNAVKSGAQADPGTVVTGKVEDKGSTDTHSANTAGPMSEDDFARYKKMVADLAASDPSYQAQKKGIEDQSARLQAFQDAPLKTDYSPLMQALDYLTHGQTHFADTYKAPLSQQDKDLMTIKLQDELQKSRSAATGLGTKLDSVLAPHGLSYQDMKTLTDAIAATQKKPNPTNIPATNFSKFASGIGSDPELKDLLKDRQGIRDAYQLLQQESAQGDKVFSPKFLKLAGEVRPPASELQSAKLIGGLGDRFDQLYEDMKNGTMDPKNRAGYAQVLRALDQVHEQAIEQKKNEYRTGGAGYGLSPGDTEKAITMKFGAKSAGLPPYQAAPKQSDLHSLTDEEVAAQYKAFKAAQQAKGK